MQALKARRAAHKHNQLGLRRTASATAVPKAPASGNQTPTMDTPITGNGTSVIARDHLALSPQTTRQTTRLPFATSYDNGKLTDSREEDAQSVGGSSSSSDSVILPNPIARLRYHMREFWAEFCASCGRVDGH